MSKTIRIVHCAETIKGGIASYLRELLLLQAQEFGANSISVVIPGSQVAELPVPPGVGVFTYSDAPGARVRNAVKLAWIVLKAVISIRPSVVHIHSTFAGATVRPLLALLGKSRLVVYCPHGWAWDRSMSTFSRRLIQFVERVLTGISAHIICISEYERSTAIQAGLNPAKLKVVLNGVAGKAPNPMALDQKDVWPDNAAIRVLFVGRFDRQKGVDILCSALTQLQGKVYALLAGGAVLSDDMNTFDLPPNAMKLGWVNAAQLETLFSQADVLVVPSRWEGFGLIATEAMRAGVAVLASRVGGLPEVVDDQVTGILCVPEEPNQLVKALSRYSKEEWHEMGQAGRLRFEKKFQMSRVHAELCDIYGVGSIQPN